MFQVLRNQGVKSVIYGVVIVATVATFAINFGPSSGGARSKPLSEAFTENCAVKVGRNCIDSKAHKSVYRVFMEGMQISAEQARSQRLSQLVAEGLIERELLAREAERLGLSVGEKEITDSIAAGALHVSVPAEQDERRYFVMNSRIFSRSMLMDPSALPWFFSQKTKEYDYKEYERKIRSWGQSTAEFREWQERELMAQKMRELIQAPIRVSDPEALARYVEEKSNATIQYVELKAEFVQRYLAEPAAADIDAWAKDEAVAKRVDAAFEKEKTSAKPALNHVRHILVKLPKGASPTTRKAKAERAAAAWARIKAGETFASVAKTFSEDSSNDAGGNVGDKMENMVVPFRDAANALKAGELSDGAVETSFGFHILQKDDPAKEAAVLTQLRHDIARRFYVEEKLVPEKMREIAGKIAETLKAGKTDDEAIAAGIALLAPAAAGPGIKIAMFEAEATASAGGPTGGPTGASDGGLVDAGAGDAKASAANSKGRYEEFKASLRDTDADKPGVITSAAFNKAGDPIESLTADATRALDTFAFTSKEGEFMPEPLLTEHGAYVVKLKERKTATKEEFAKDRDTFSAEMIAQKRKEALSLYLKRVRDRSKDEIKIFYDKMVDTKPKSRDGGPEPVDPGMDDDGN